MLIQPSVTFNWGKKSQVRKQCTAEDAEAASQRKEGKSTCLWMWGSRTSFCIQKEEQWGEQRKNTLSRDCSTKKAKARKRGTNTQKGKKGKRISGKPTRNELIAWASEYPEQQPSGDVREQRQCPFKGGLCVGGYMNADDRAVNKVERGKNMNKGSRRFKVTMFRNNSLTSSQDL